MESGFSLSCLRSIFHPGAAYWGGLLWTQALGDECEEWPLFLEAGSEPRWEEPWKRAPCQTSTEEFPECSTSMAVAALGCRAAPETFSIQKATHRPQK